MQSFASVNAKLFYGQCKALQVSMQNFAMSNAELFDGKRINIVVVLQI